MKSYVIHYVIDYVKYGRLGTVRIKHNLFGCFERDEIVHTKHVISVNIVGKKW